MLVSDRIWLDLCLDRPALSTSWEVGLVAARVQNKMNRDMSREVEVLRGVSVAVRKLALGGQAAGELRLCAVHLS